MFTINELNSLYLDICKDRLYLEAENSVTRRACQTVLVKLLQFVAASVAPIACHTAEDIFQFTPPQLRRLWTSARDDLDSVFGMTWPDAPVRSGSATPTPAAGHPTIQALMTIRTAVDLAVGHAIQKQKAFNAKREAHVRYNLLPPPCFLSVESIVLCGVFHYISGDDRSARKFISSSHCNGVRR